MARQEINLGVLPNGVGGDTPRVANTKINDMTTELYAAIAEGGTVKSVAEVQPDAAGDISKAELATAIGVDDKADKAATEVALDLKADKAAVNIALSEKADKTALDNKVDKLVGKGLSANDFTTAEKTKLGALTNLKDQGIGGSAVAVPSNDCNKALVAGVYAAKPTTLNGMNVYGTLEVLDYGDNTSTIQRLTTTRGHPIGEITWFRSASGSSWTPWNRFFNVGNFGIGADPRAALPIEYITNMANLRPSGKYIITPETVDGPGFYGTLEMSWYDPTGWTMLARPLTGGAMATKASINGAVGPWQWYYPTKRYQSAGLTYTNGQLQAVQHGLGAIPTSMQLFVVPTVDQASWSAGIYVLPASGCSIGANPTEVFIKVASTGLTVLDAQTGASANLTPANWRIVIRAAA
ncbi:hypothetical protein ACIPI6_00340 [Pseudomonas protegens]|uniref:pyocin knob domain-containing protein n=1 Tax=Pseudomonas protegens TaxID=380021 RepID=UPI00381831EA